MHDDKLVRTLLDSAIQRAGAGGRHGREDLAPAASARAGAFVIRAVHIAMGEMMEIDAEAFRAAWRDAARGTPAEQAALHIRRSPAELQCMVCFEKYRPVGTAPLCPYCGSVGAKVLSGEECRIESVEVNNA